ncbi:unnamed protein product [Sphagnum jensenii]|uniref:Uncharacterized protein n=1 Tax=Sphagnum jensenii TaxID=128206 RepID=A0ABP0VBE7_9BRYO
MITLGQPCRICNLELKPLLITRPNLYGTLLDTAADLIGCRQRDLREILDSKQEHKKDILLEFLENEERKIIQNIADLESVCRIIERLRHVDYEVQISYYGVIEDRIYELEEL